MVVLGVLLVLIGAALLVAEAHVPTGALAVGGGLALAGGAALAIAGAGGSAAIVVPAAVGSLAIAGLWVAVATRKGLASQALRARAGSEALCGRLGVIRNWNGDGGQILVEGALWRARRSLDPSAEADLGEGDQVVVERVSGLTLAVRKAEDWEIPW
jgi:membrane-bound ClpP family serine protease